MPIYPNNIFRAHWFLIFAAFLVRMVIKYTLKTWKSVYNFIWRLLHQLFHKNQKNIAFFPGLLKIGLLFRSVFHLHPIHQGDKIRIKKVSWSLADLKKSNIFWIFIADLVQKASNKFVNTLPHLQLYGNTSFSIFQDTHYLHQQGCHFYQHEILPGVTDLILMLASKNTSRNHLLGKMKLKVNYLTWRK